MALHGVVVLNKVMADDVRTLNRSAVNAADLDNGSVVVMGAKDTDAGYSEVFETSQPTSGAGLQNLWMVYSDEIALTDIGNGKLMKGLSVDPRDFINKAGYVMDVFKPMVGDIITLSAEAIGGTKNSNGYVVATASQDKLQWAAAAVSGLSLKLIGENDLSIATGAIDTQRTIAYQFEVVAVA